MKFIRWYLVIELFEYGKVNICILYDKVELYVMYLLFVF